MMLYQSRTAPAVREQVSGTDHPSGMDSRRTLKTCAVLASRHMLRPEFSTPLGAISPALLPLSAARVSPIGDAVQLATLTGLASPF